jgi:hypothetical protein
MIKKNTAHFVVILKKSQWKTIFFLDFSLVKSVCLRKNGLWRRKHKVELSVKSVGATHV